jgi:TolA-binding protein
MTSLEGEMFARTCEKAKAFSMRRKKLLLFPHEVKIKELEQRIERLEKKIDDLRQKPTA